MSRLHGDPLALYSTRESKHLPDEIRSPFRTLVQCVQSPQQRRIARFQPEQFQSHHDRREHVVEIVGNSARQCTKTLETLSSQKLLFELFVFGNVCGYRQKSVDASIRVISGRSRNQEVYRLSCFIVAAQFEVLEGLAAQGSFVE